MHAEAGEAETAHLLRIDPVGAVVEERWIELDLVHGSAIDLVDLHPLDEMQAEVKERDLEGELGVAPERAVGLEADVAVAVVTDVLQLLGQFGIRLFERSRGELLCAAGHVVESEAERGERYRRGNQRDEQGVAARSPLRSANRHESRASLKPLNCQRAVAGKKFR